MNIITSIMSYHVKTDWPRARYLHVVFERPQPGREAGRGSDGAKSESTSGAVEDTIQP